MFTICHAVNLLADLSYAALLVWDQQQIPWAGDSALRADSRFLGDRAAFGMTS